MASNLSVKITGVDEMRAAFAKSPAIVISELKPAIAKTIAAIQRAAAPRTPWRHGFLLNRNEIRLGDLTGLFKKLAPYAVFVHEGTYKMKGRPFLSQGIDATAKEVDNIFRNALANITLKLAK
jgi:HK97 gp10 family phage protein